MKRRFFASLAAAAAVTASMVMVSAADAATPDTRTAAGAQSAGVTPDANVPEAVRVGPGYKIVASLRGVGKQIYDCNGAAYAFREPAAGLFTSRGVPVCHPRQGAVLDELRRLARGRQPDNAPVVRAARSQECSVAEARRYADRCERRVQ